MRILITGVAGFIGSNLADRLLRDRHTVSGIDNLSAGRRVQVPRGVRFHKADICTRAILPLFRGVDVVYHLAAKNCIADCQQDPVATAMTNVVGTVNVCAAAHRAGVKKIIYAETSALYEGVRRLPTPEGAIAPESFYAISKACDGMFVEGFRRWAKMRATALRYFNVYGPRQDYRRTIPPVMSAFIIRLLRGEQPVIYGSGRARRDFVHVDDVNDFHLLCLNNRRTDGRVYNVGSGANYSILDIYRHIARLLRSPLRPIHTPALEGEARVTLADITAARRLGWRPRVSLDEGLRGMVAYIRQEVARGRI